MDQRGLIESNLQTYIHSATMPCPYARLPILYTYLKSHIGNEGTRKQLSGALDRYWWDETKSIFAVIPLTEPSDHVEARTQAYWLRYHLHYLNIEATGRMNGNRAAVESRLQELYLNWISDVDSFIGPRVVVGDIDIMMTAFNPLYDPVHPRYAPHTFFSIIRSKDLLAVHEERPDIAYKIATHAKCKIVRSMLTNRFGIDLDAMRNEYDSWLEALGFYKDFITTAYTDSYRMDPRTQPRVEETRRFAQECMQSERFRASLAGFRAMILNSDSLPTLQRILAQNPEVSVFDIARVVYGDVSGMYVFP